MEVFAIPTGPDRYELYCEPSVAPLEPLASGTGLLASLRHRFLVMLRTAEDRRQGDPSAFQPATSWLGRVQDRIFAWVAERVAEQRLLWSLRRETTAVVSHPQDMTADESMTLVRRVLQRDHRRHLRWLVVHALLSTGAIVLIPVPGPNLIGYYFAFRLVGHWLSMRGASQGLHRIQWTARSCPPLTELRDLAALAPAAREARVQDIASRLRLNHLTTFFERVAVHA